MRPIMFANNEKSFDFFLIITEQNPQDIAYRIKVIIRISK